MIAHALDLDFSLKNWFLTQEILHSLSKAFYNLNQSQNSSDSPLPTKDAISNFTLHQQWSNQGG